MKRIFYLVGIILFLLLMPAVQAVEEHTIQYTIDGDTTYVSHSLTLSGDFAVFMAPEDAYNFDVSVNNKATTFNIKRLNGEKQVSIPLSSGRNEVSVFYKTNEFIERGAHSYFVGDVVSFHSVDIFTVYLILPDGAILSRPLTSVTPPVSPAPESVETTGRSIHIKWEKEKVDAGDGFIIFVSYNPKTNFLGYLLIGVIVLFAIFIVLHFNPKLIPNQFLRKKLSEKKFDHLLKSEQKIVDALLNAKENVLFQKELQYKTDFTKSKLSRTIRNMQKRGIVEKIPYGATNKIRLITKEDEEE